MLLSQLENSLLHKQQHSRQMQQLTSLQWLMAHVLLAQ
jgi:hypothetical protein